MRMLVRMDKVLLNRIYVLFDGCEVQEVIFCGYGLIVKVLMLGVVVCELNFEGFEFFVVFGYENVVFYVVNYGFFGVIVGCYVNCLKGGQFQIDGQWFQVDWNDNGNVLYGGL